MTTVALWSIWSLILLSLGVVIWRKTQAKVRTYALIAVSGLYLAGIFVSYGLVNRIPLW